uniref:Uncharacterized protein n=1 Tax=Romanomermis culicivorax TaxID=13658 RepID=A0A915L0C3_ROMCU
VWKFALQEAFNIQAHYRTVGPEHCRQFTYHVPPGSTIVVDENGPAIHTPDGILLIIIIYQKLKLQSNSQFCTMQNLRRVVFVCQDPYFRDYAYGPNYCSAMLTGAALGTLMFWPWWFFWF